MHFRQPRQTVAFAQYTKLRPQHFNRSRGDTQSGTHGGPDGGERRCKIGDAPRVTSAVKRFDAPLDRCQILKAILPESWRGRELLSEKLDGKGKGLLAAGRISLKGIEFFGLPPGTICWRFQPKPQ